MKVASTALAGVLLVEPRVFVDHRGYFFEAWEQARYSAIGVDKPFVQDNLSSSARGVVRGLHLQHPHGQAKLVSVVMGTVLDVAVDLRRGSPTFGRSVVMELSEENHRQLYIPSGFGHGFCVLSAVALVTYKCTERYRAEAELGVRFDDPELDIPWPVDAPIVSGKDLSLPWLRDLDLSSLPEY